MLSPGRVIDSMKTRVLTLADVSPLEHQISTWQPSGLSTPVLVISFSGIYRYGSQGEPDSRLMESVVAGARIAFCPEAIVLDLSQLDYQWGDDLRHVVRTAIGRSDQVTLPVTAAIGPKAWDGWKTFAPLFASALAGFWFDNVGEAVLHASRQAKMVSAKNGVNYVYQQFTP